MNTSMIGRWIGAGLTAGALAFAVALPSYAAEATPTTSAVVGVPGTPFIFESAGFQDSEHVSYWINTPDGTVIATKPLDKPDKSGRTTTPLLDWADANGNVTIYWTAPSNAIPGSYSVVIHGLASSVQKVIPFTINAAGSQIETQSNVTPAAGPVGTLFIFHATGFVGSTVVDGEHVSYWINTPDGKVISTEPLNSPNKIGGTTRPLQAQAGTDGVVKIFWTATAGLNPGSYSLVVHGLVSQHEVLIPFTIQ
ncbi:MAG: hypothetical protein WCI67_03265 [Chloroflexales bacterium]